MLVEQRIKKLLDECGDVKFFKQVVSEACDQWTLDNDVGITVSALSRILNKHHSYVQQLVRRGFLEKLSDDTISCESARRLLDERLKPREYWDKRYKAPEGPYKSGL